MYVPITPAMRQPSEPPPATMATPQALSTITQARLRQLVDLVGGLNAMNREWLAIRNEVLAGCPTEPGEITPKIVDGTRTLSSKVYAELEESLGVGITDSIRSGLAEKPFRPMKLEINGQLFGFHEIKTSSSVPEMISIADTASQRAKISTIKKPASKRFRSFGEL